MTALLTIHGCSKWLKANHVTPNSRSAVYTAIARNRLRVIGETPTALLVSQSDLEKYAAELRKEEVTE